DLPDLHSLPTRRSSDLSFALSLSVTTSSTDFRFTPAERSCSSNTFAGILSSTANWFTVLLGIKFSLPLQRFNNWLMATDQSVNRSEEHTSELQSRENLV